MSAQYDTYLTLAKLFTSQIFSPEFEIIENNDIILFHFDIGYSNYCIEILDNGSINCSISNIQSQERLNNTELQVLFNCINQANMSYQNPPKHKLWLHLAQVWN